MTTIETGSAVQYRWIMDALKRALKAKGISYRELAPRLGVTESAVKKMFAAPDCAFGRIQELCGIVGMPLADLIAEQDGSDVEDVAFTPAQQDFFLRHMDYWRFYWKLAFERRTPEEIRAAEGFTAAEVFRYLKKLDELRLIRLEPGDRVRPPRLKRIRSFGDGPLIRRLYRDWSIGFMEEIARPDPGPGRRFILRYLRMKRETYAEFLAEIGRLEMEFLKRAVREMSLHRDGLTHVRWVCAVDAQSFVGRVRE